ncbi:MAG TPA: nuclear transport factor 2 family protein [Pyrinomonadaceae bacterium]|nr:nuclear transport factor 2 family protein [Pyrinomonadaceae bacterium]
MELEGDEMLRINSRVILILTIFLACFCETLDAQLTRERTTQNVCSAASGLTGVYRIDAADSDRLYSVIEGATSNVPYSEQQQFFMDLAVRLTPPDLLAIECRGSRVTLGSSRAPKVVFQADGATRTARTAGGQIVRSRIGLERNSLVFSSSGGSNDNLSFTFTPLENGQRLRVTRRIAAKELVEPVVIQTVYNKIADVARWDIYGESQADRLIVRQDSGNASPSALPSARSSRSESDEADTIRETLNQWIAATNRRNIEKQMSFYMPELKAFYLARNASRNSVRVEKIRLAAVKSIDIRAEEPEIIFQDGGRTAIMRFRKKYKVEDKSRIRRGEVVQELRWQRTTGGWRIFSERDIKVIS